MAVEVIGVGNDWMVTLSGLQSSTADSTSYINSSTGVTCRVYADSGGVASTGTDVLPSSSTAAFGLSYLTGTNGNYRKVIGSTESTALTVGSWYWAIVTVAHSGSNGEWRNKFKFVRRGST